MSEKCYFCESTETLYCSICKKWMCDGCRKNYYKRIGEVARIGINKVREKLKI